MNIEQAIKHLDAARAALVALSGGVASEPDVATKAEILHEYGDPGIKYPPKSMAHIAGKNLSHLTKDELLELAGKLEYRAKMADKDGRLDKNGNPASKYDWRNARLARGWAAHGPASKEAAAPLSDVDEETPF